MRLAIVTIAAGRHDHLRRQREWVARLDPAPLTHLVVSMGDPELRGIVAAVDAPHRVVELPRAEHLPLARARNTGVDAARDAGADAVALLDVDCLPDRRFVAVHLDALAAASASADPAAISGRVKYLPPGIDDADHTPDNLALLGEDHDVRVVPADAALEPGDPRPLWSLNIGMTLDDWDRVGGFDEAYTGYGGEDTDFGQRLDAAGGTMWWTGRALAYHQYHPVSRPPLEHVEDIVRNAELFRDRWGFVPMAGWLEEFERRGLVVQSGGRWRVA
ncbi:glycosyltransferase family 2 protein [Gulosibacter massiliensis]|uniref:glycosyltransferase family 2 protein n=1 Tax=Gulosibacter massiliensis TaxID=2479839 RepID=UPI000F63A065|nr:galactosyltransferase-related protein [Gulosibacter massiliensis]